MIRVLSPPSWLSVAFLPGAATANATLIGRAGSQAYPGRDPGRIIGLLLISCAVCFVSTAAQSASINSFADMPGGAFNNKPGSQTGAHHLGPYTFNTGGGETVVVTSKSYVAGSTTVVANEPANMGSNVPNTLCPNLCTSAEGAPGDWKGESGIGTGGIVLNFSQPLSGAGLSLMFSMKPGDPMQPIQLSAFDGLNNTGQLLATSTSPAYPFLNSWDPEYDSSMYYLRYFTGVTIQTPQIQSLLIQLTGGTYGASIDGYALRSAAIPEPTTALLLTLGLAGLGLQRRASGPRHSPRNRPVFGTISSTWRGRIDAG